MTLTAYLAHLDFKEQLAGELHNVKAVYDRLFLCEGPRQHSIWAQNTWLNPAFIEITSINDGAKKLKSIQRNWAAFSYEHRGRVSLISEALPHVSAKRIAFDGPKPTAPMGGFMLVEPNLMLASSETSSLWPHGAMEFLEDKTNPPSRAYLKLWDLFTRMNVRPKKGDVCLDLGASPGGWTWVLAQLGAHVIAVDRSPLQTELMENSLVKFKKGDAFKITPRDFPEIDWVFSDLICYPEKLHEFLLPWLADSKPRNFVLTIKFQGENPYGILDLFRSIPNSEILHLYHNKHEVTWILVKKDPVNLGISN